MPKDTEKNNKESYSSAARDSLVQAFRSSSVPATYESDAEIAKMVQAIREREQRFGFMHYSSKTITPEEVTAARLRSEGAPSKSKPSI